MMAKKKKLNTKQKLWADYFLSNGFNKSLASKQAGYNAKSDSGFRKIGWENSTKPHIQEYIEERMEDVVMGANEVLARINEMAIVFDPLEYIEQVETYVIDKKGKKVFAGYDMKIDLKKIQADGYGILVKSVRSTANGVHIVWHDSLDALIRLGTHYKLFTTKVDLGGQVETTVPTATIISAIHKAKKEMKK